MERREDRLFMAGDGAAVQMLPFTLEFDAARAGTNADKDGEGTGMTYVQPNRLGNEYQAGLIDLRPADGALYLTTTGTAAAGGPWEGDNTLVNALQTGFDPRTGSFPVTTPPQGAPAVP